MAHFLSQRNNSRTTDSHSKMRREITNVVGPMRKMLLLGSTVLSGMTNFAGTTCGPCDDCKSHTREASTLGHGVFTYLSDNHKLITKSSIESEIVGMSDCMPKVSHCGSFLDAQFFIVERNVVPQDN